MSTTPPQPPTVQSPLIDFVPRPVYRSVEAAIRIANAPKDIPGLAWGDVEGVLVTFWLKGDDDVAVAYELLSPEQGGAYSAVDVLRTFAASTESLQHPRGYPLFGLGMVAERLEVDAKVDDWAERRRRSWPSTPTSSRADEPDSS